MPAYTPIRDFINALNSGQTNITKRIKYLVENYSIIPGPNLAALTGWSPAGSPPIPDLVRDLLMHNGACAPLSPQNKLSKDEVDHIDALDPSDKAKVLAWVAAVIAAPPAERAAAEIWWELRRQPAPGGPPGDDVVYDSVTAPLKITGRTWGGRVELGWIGGFNLGSIKYKKP